MEKPPMAGNKDKFSFSFSNKKLLGYVRAHAGWETMRAPHGAHTHAHTAQAARHPGTHTHHTLHTPQIYHKLPTIYTHPHHGWAPWPGPPSRVCAQGCLVSCRPRESCCGASSVLFSAGRAAAAVGCREAACGWHSTRQRGVWVTMPADAEDMGMIMAVGGRCAVRGAK